MPHIDRRDLSRTDSEPGAGVGTVLVTFETPPWAECSLVELLGEFVAWTPLAMDARPDGGFTLSVRLEAGRRWMYRFRLDGDVVVNDPGAHTFTIFRDGSWISVLHT